VFRRSRIAVPAAAVLCGLALLTTEGPATQGEVVQLAAEKTAPRADDDTLGPDPRAADGPRATKVQREVADRLSALLTPKGEKPADGAPVSLDQGLIGVIGSPAAGYTLVVTKETDGKALVSSLTAGLPEEARKALDVRVSERSAAELREAWAAVWEQRWRTLTPEPETGYSVDLDPELEAVVVVIGSEAPPTDRLDTLRQPLQGVDAGAVVVQYGGASGRASRTSDSAPHWGAAKITKSGGTFCTAGFTARGRSSGAYYSVTAAHCGPNGTRWNSGSHFYGTTAGRSGYPSYDQARLGGSSYSPNIYTDGLDNFTSRVVTGANDGAVGDSVCASGTVTRSICGIKIKSLTATYCDIPGNQSTCTTYLMRGRRDDDKVVARNGDSGGPVYQRNSTLPRASIRGIVVAFDTRGVRVFAERYASISNHLNVTAVTAG
jgi:hypothetical protein